MAVEPVVVRIPHELLTHFEERAQRTQRTVEEEIIEAMATTARDSHLSSAASDHLEELNQKRQSLGLTGEEERMAEALLHEYERLMLLRAEALARLKESGSDIGPLLEPRSA